MNKLFNELEPWGLNDPVSYNRGLLPSVGNYPALVGDIGSRAKEVMNLTYDPSQEIIHLVSFESLPSMVVYMGRNAKQMKKNLDNLRLPFCPQNLGEIIFHVFKGKLEEQKNSAGPICLSGELEQGRERELSFVLKKQLYVWNNGRAIDGTFFEKYKRLS